MSDHIQKNLFIFNIFRKKKIYIQFSCFNIVI